MRRSASVRDETHAQGSAHRPLRRTPDRASDRAEDATTRRGSVEPNDPSALLALQRTAGNAAVTAVVQRMEAAPGGKRKRSGSPEEQEAPKQAREAASSSEVEEEEETSSEEEEWEEPFSEEVLARIGDEQTRLTALLERMDEDGAPDHVKDLAKDRRTILTLVRNLAPLRSVATVREAIRLVREMPDSKTRTKYLGGLGEQLAYLTQTFPSAGPPTAKTLRDLWPRLVPAFGSAGGQVGEDGCEDRAHATCLAIAELSPAIAAHHLSKQWATSSGTRLHADHQWNHHVAASVTTSGGVLVIDPVFSRTGPIELSRWADHVQVDDEANIHQTAWGFLGKPGTDHRPDATSAVEYTPLS
ncbi:protein-glutamine glutaminase family protein [Streptacidiphilus anmyonensis]|uniref:protein-glutamine glutaminase family protein n=1 Tax=Streptacidiphilus anmyonensis TaxID=405782 RepID=UPI0005AAD9F0|nr:protein-glutamine glutaminase family protein [Streptacidiphilus anmyonensis]